MKVKFLPQDVEFEIKPSDSVMNVAHENGIYVKSVCKGVPNCAECRVRVIEGDHNVMPPGSEELSLIGTGYFIDRRRLSCQLKCFGDITVDMTEQLAKQSGLIGGRKTKKALAKDDRVEQAVARRSEDPSETTDLESDDVDAIVSTSTPNAPVHGLREERGPREHRSSSATMGPPSGPRPAGPRPQIKSAGGGSGPRSQPQGARPPQPKADGGGSGRDVGSVDGASKKRRRRRGGKGRGPSGGGSGGGSSGGPGS